MLHIQHLDILQIISASSQIQFRLHLLTFTGTVHSENDSHPLCIKICGKVNIVYFHIGAGS